MVRVTEADLWRKVGRIMESARGSRSYTSIKDETGIDPKTMQSIEAGSPGNLGKLERYAHYLGLNLLDVLTALLSAEPLNPQSAELLRRFGDLSERQRKAYLQILRVAGRDVAEEPPTGHRSPAGRQKREPDRP